MKMRNRSTGATVEVDRHYITKNFWEYYLEKPDENGQAFGLVLGHETELGYVDVDEIRPFVVMSARPEDTDFAPAPNWEWVFVKNREQNEWRDN